MTFFDCRQAERKEQSIEVKNLEEKKVADHRGAEG